MIHIQFNEKEISVEDFISLAAFLEAQKFELGAVAVAVNQRFVPRSLHAKTFLADGDCILCVTPMQGG